MEKFLNEVKSFLKAFFWFVFACFLIPVLLFSLICERYKFKFTNYILGLKYPTLTISTSRKIRSLVDTPRNAGIFHFLVQVKGKCDFDKIKQQYVENLTEVREKSGLLKFPKLRQQLVACWGHYAWVKDNSSFDIDNHVVLSPQNFRGRAINDSNIQEFVSDLVAKYIPSDQPQWQVIVIPTRTTTSTGSEIQQDEQYYMLLKLHHLIIAEEEDLHISEMLMLKDKNYNRQLLKMEDASEQSLKENLSHFVRKPVHIQNLLQQLWTLVIHVWNEFIYEFESLETPDDVAQIKVLNLSKLLSLLLIITVNVCVEYWKTVRKPLGKRLYSGSSWTILNRCLHEEIHKRQITWEIVAHAISNSLHPTNLAKSFTKFVWHANVKKFLLFPYSVYCELVACRDLIMKGQTSATKTYVSRVSIFLPLIIYAQVEFFKICYEIFKAPVNIYEELIEHPSREPNILQMKSYSGRKIVSFSKSLSAHQIRERNNFTKDVHESDFVLACLAGSIHDYFKTFKDTAPVPRILNTTCRTITKGYFTDHLEDKHAYVGGVVFLQIPLSIPHHEHAKQIHSIVENIRSKQIMIYLSSMAQTKFDFLTSLLPSVFTKIFINYFSYNFPVTITEIHGATPEFELIWGQKVEDVLLFRPPQSKTCLSLNIHRFGDKYRLAVMADTQLGVDHAKITRSFERYMETATV